jgi:alkyl hydroperoxide reductase subunit D
MDSHWIDEVFAGRDTTIARDLKLNLKRVLSEGALSPEEANLTLLACASSVGFAEAARNARIALEGQGVAAEVIQEASESAAIMAMLNIYYRFRHFVGKDEDYKMAGLRMTALARPLMGKEKFELLATAVSAINGCETCVKGHEATLREGAMDVAKIHDAVRMAAIVKALSVLKVG